MHHINGHTTDKGYVIDNITAPHPYIHSYFVAENHYSPYMGIVVR